MLINSLINLFRFTPMKQVDNALNKEGEVEGLCFIRTQGARNEMLEESVRSVLIQKKKMIACIILHGNHKSFTDLKKWSNEKFGNQVVLLHASNIHLERGYPLNVGLNFLKKNANRFNFFCFLDDDDIYYPIFSERIANEFLIIDADVIYCLANYRRPGGELGFQHEALPSSCLVTGNFIPINAYIISTKFFIQNNIYFREDFRYLEDWDFLLSLLIAGARFKHIPEALSEYRLISDGNLVIKKDPPTYDRICKLLITRGKLIAKILGLNHFHQNLIEFGFDRINKLPATSQKQILNTFEVFGGNSSPSE